MRTGIVSFILLLAAPTWAGFAGQLTGFYLADNFTQTTLSSQARSFYTAELYYSHPSYKNFYFGMNLTGVAQNDVVATTMTNYSSQDYGLVALYCLDKSHHWTVAGAYNISASGVYETTGGAVKTWTGISYWGRIGYQTELKKNFSMGVNLTYYNADYASQTQSGLTQGVSVQRNWILPVFSISYWNQ